MGVFNWSRDALKNICRVTKEAAANKDVPTEPGKTYAMFMAEKGCDSEGAGYKVIKTSWRGKFKSAWFRVGKHSVGWFPYKGCIYHESRYDPGNKLTAEWDADLPEGYTDGGGNGGGSAGGDGGGSKKKQKKDKKKK